MHPDDISTTDAEKDPPLQRLAGEKSGALAPTDTVATAAERMRELDAKKLPVAEDRKLVGVVEDNNPDCKLGGRGHDPQTWQVGEIMKRDAIFCFEDEGCKAAHRKMEEHDLKYLPVVDRQMKIVSIVEREEVVKRAAEARSE